MPKWYKVQVVVPHDNGLPEDAITNTWHFLNGETTPDRAADNTAFTAALAGFYQAWVPEMGSSQYDWANIVAKAYDFADERPRIPFAETAIATDPPLSGRNDWPAEVAVCLSMQGVVTSGVNARRRRGRVFIGPLAVGNADVPNLPQVNAEIILDAASENLYGIGDVKLAVYSRLTHYGIPVGGTIGPEDEEVPANLGASMNEVVKLWVDNAFDTQRRRGPKASARYTANRP